jgi:hypothetical protein
MNITGGLNITGRINFISTAPDMYNITYLVVGGGGGTYNSTQVTATACGGGGAGGLLYGTASVASGTTYEIIVGAGGSGQYGNGGDSSIKGTSSFGPTTSISITAFGGGVGNNALGGFDGGSGGGAVYGINSSLPGLGTTGQGNSGGTVPNTIYAGGGGGAGSAGYAGATPIRAGNGGDGQAITIRGTVISSSNVSISTGTKTFVVPSGLSYTGGDHLRFYYDSSNIMYGTVTSYGGMTLTVSITKIVGSGTYSSWAIDYTYAGGGGAAARTYIAPSSTEYTGTGGFGGGGAGSSTGNSGRDNTGGGAGAPWTNSSANGGSGIVIISYQSNSQRSSTGEINSYTSNGLTYWVHVFTTTGTYTA